MNDKQDPATKRSIELKDIETPSVDAPINIGINILEEEMNSSQVPVIEFGFILTERATIRTDLEAPVGQTLSSEDTPGLILVTHETASHIERVNDEMWKPDRPKDEMWAFASTSYEAELPDQSLLTSELELWANHQFDGYFEPDEYRFPHRFWLNDEEIEWSFTITVS